MSKDPLALAAITGGPPQEAEYDAVYAAVTATERGRWFLTEFANRNRNTDTHLVVAALARIETSIRGEAAPQFSVGLCRDLTGIAAAVEQVRTALAERAPAPDVAAAVERIQDISFSLRERAVDGLLCDGLDAALKDISDACAPQQANGKARHAAAELLHDIAARLDALIKLSLNDAGSGALPNSADRVPDAPQQTAIAGRAARTEKAAAADDGLSQLDCFATEFVEGKRFSVTVADLAASLTSAASAIATPNMFGDAIAPPPADQVEPEAPAQTNGGARWYIESPDFLFQPAAPEPEQERADTFPESSHAHALLPETQLQSGPEDDPAGLFETAVPTAAAPIVAASTVATPSVVAAAVPSSAVTEFYAPAEPPPPQLRVANGSAARPEARVTPRNLLAALRGLSEDELRALFS